MTIRAAVFDAYGTLFDVAAAARRVAGEPGNAALAAAWPKLADFWRHKQLQYTWLRTITGEHADFWQVTQDGLDWSLAALGMDDPRVRDRLLALYRELDAYAEVPEVLRALKAAGLKTAILSNGSPDMLSDAVRSAGIGHTSTPSSRSRRWASSSPTRASTALSARISAWPRPRSCSSRRTAGTWRVRPASASAPSG
jgi:2-haloacid dehalogenase